MNKRLFAVMLVLAGSFAGLAEVLAGGKPDLGWLAGRWCGALETGAIEEVWLAPSGGGETLGVSRTVRQGSMVSFEYLRIVSVDGKPVYVAQPGGRAPTNFSAMDIGPGWIVFENPDHDFPQRIEYRRKGDGLEAVTSGPGPEGERTAFAFRYTVCP